MASQQVNFERTLLAASGSSAANDMGLTVFSGVVLEAFTAGSVFYDRSNSFMSIKQLNGGVSAQWPIIGKDPMSSYHTPGTFINEQSTQGTNVKRIQMYQKTITCDDYLVNALDVPFTDLNLLHFDVLGPFATKLGRNLARVLDRKIAMLSFKASLEPQQVTSGDVHSGGFNVHTTGATGGAANVIYPASPQGAYNFRKDLASLAQKFDEGNVPDGSRYLFITPTIKTALRFETNWSSTASAVIAANVMPSHFNADTSSDPSDVASRVIGNLEGFNIIMTNNLPAADYSTSGTTVEDGAVFSAAKYRLNTSGLTTYKQPVAVALCSADTGSPAIGMVQASGLQTYMEDDQRRNTKFMKAQLMCGLDTLCPWSAGSISVSVS
ncbi:major capsid protein [uncultured Caudovirales phage]|uniref:Major capsid protein n=3 Tax=uncultured Caudovirales phage TaxID=2100421 RepID=A0A6J5QCH7_9CAUD|nr:major capsid protein [uncultured Caudovirales phage]CAB4170275.1 major capsid protein [uncultured Caudovirales phage]CAB4177344.1 major capsid protein [uncultured Caudovirales phage]CAB4182585.1 major capsid protein [uncultured Caudovirales phage]CAB4199358.1 major capsid protein [uncultured Caudovirales phage]